VSVDDFEGGRRPARIVFYGSPSCAVPSLEALAKSPAFEVIAVVTRPAQRIVRGRRESGTPVADAATALGIPVLAPQRVSEILEWLRDRRPDIGAIVGYGQIIPPAVIEAHRLGMVNLHFSLLPKWRGAAPVQRAIMAGDTETGVCTMLIDAGLDTGPLLDCVKTQIRPEETAGELEERLAQLGAPLLAKSLESLVAGRATPVSQRDEDATYAPPLRREECEIDWNEPAPVLERLIRACSPKPLAHTRFRGRLLKVARARAFERLPAALAREEYVPEDLPAAREQTAPVEDESYEPPDSKRFFPGEVVVPHKGNPLVACGQGFLELVEVQLEGRSRVSGEAFARGARLRPDERLGD
jgi:methionyl-tRNA formyltransferase